MTRYRVFFAQTISYFIDVEADSEEEAIEEAETEGLPGVMMLDHRYPDESGWETTGDVEVIDE
jgi:hypothetical protein